MRQWRRSPFINQQVSLRLTENGIEGVSPTGSGIMAWDVVTRAARFSDGWLLFHGPQFYRWLPEAALTADSTAISVESLIRTHVTDVR
jgi:hypothetical protein